MHQTIARTEGQRPIIKGRLGPLSDDIRVPAYQAFLLLWAAFTVAPFLFGLDKFFNWMTFWPNYLWVGFPHLFGVAPQTFMYGVGVVEMAAGVLVFLLPRFAPYVVACWLAGIITNLVIISAAASGHGNVFWDIALRGTQPETLRLELRDGCAGEAPVRPGHRPLMVIEHRSGVELAQDLNQPGHQAGPPGLVCGTEPGAVVAMEVLVEQDEVPPVRVLLEQSGPAIDGPPSVVTTQERADEAAGQLLRHLEQRHHRPRARRALDPQIVTVIPVVRDQGPDQ